jgi:WD40 repeat protein
MKHVVVLLIALSTVASAFGDIGDDPLPENCVLRFGTSRFRHGIPISMLAISRDGKLAIAVNGNHMLGCTRAFDLQTGSEIFRLSGWEGTQIEAAAISPDGKFVVTKQDFSLRVREPETGHELRKIDLPRVVNGSYNQNEWLKFTPDGRFMVVTSQGKDIHVIDFESGAIVRSLPNEDDNSNVSQGWGVVLGIAISPDGKRLASGGFNNDHDNYFARLWDMETGKELRRFMHGRSYGVESLAFSSDGKVLATGAHDAVVRLFDVDSGKLIKALPKNGHSRMHAGCVAISPDGKSIASAGESLRVYDIASGKELWHVDKRARGLQFTDGGKSITGAAAGAIYTWDATTGKPLTPDAADSAIAQILTSADGKRLVTLGDEGDAHVWDAVTGKHVRYVRATWQRGIALSRDGRFLVWPVEDEKKTFQDPAEPRLRFEENRLRVYEIDADRVIDRFANFEGDAHDLAFIENGKKLVTVDHRNAMVRTWNFETGKEERRFRALRETELAQQNCVNTAEVSPDGKRLALAYTLRTHNEQDGLERLGGGDERSAVRVWDIDSGNEVHDFASQARYARNLSFSPDGQWFVASGSRFDAIGEAKLTIWNVQSGAMETTIPARACVVAFSHDGRYLATATPEGNVELWATATWSKLADYSAGHRDRPTALMFSPDNTRLYSGSLDTTVLAWEIPK